MAKKKPVRQFQNTLVGLFVLVFSLVALDVVSQAVKKRTELRSRATETTPIPRISSIPSSKPTASLTVSCPSCPTPVNLRKEERSDRNYNITINWPEVQGAINYYIYRCFGKDCYPNDYVSKTDGNTSFYRDTNDSQGYSNNRTVRYRVRPYRSTCYMPACGTSSISL